MRSCTWILVLGILFTMEASAQFLDVPLSSEQFPPDLSWRRMATSYGEFLFPVEAQDAVRDAARYLEAHHAALERGLRVHTPRLPIVINTTTAEANGNLAFLPWRSEWYGRPPEGRLLGTQPWLHTLALHEYRHAVQFAQARQGLIRVGSWLWGEAGWAGLAVFAIPSWYWEGDAVVMETALSRTGRGRMPDFLRPWRTIRLSGRKDSYYKAYLGSYADPMPSIYHLGYLLAGSIRQRYGPSVLPDVVEATSWMPFLPGLFSVNLKGRIGRGTAGLYQETMADLDSVWKEQDLALAPTPVRVESPDPGDAHVDYFSAHTQGDTIFAVRRSLDDPPMLVRIIGEREEVVQSYLPIERISVRAGKAAWTELHRHSRWGRASTSELMLLDVHTGCTRRLSDQGRWFSPALSPDGAYLAAVWNGSDLHHRIEILDANTGQRLHVLPNPGNEVVQEPSWSEDGTRIVYTRTGLHGKSLCSAPPFQGSEEVHLLAGTEDVHTPRLRDSLLIFVSSRTGLDQIHGLHLGTGERRILARSRFGVDAPEFSRNGSRLLWSEDRITGYRIVSQSFESLGGEPDTARPVILPFVDTLVAQEGGPVSEDDDTVEVLQPISDVSRHGSLFSFHSWGLLPSGDGIDQGWSVMLHSRNVMHTLGVAAGYQFGTDGRSGDAVFAVSWAGWVPILDLHLRSGRQFSSYSTGSGEVLTASWKEQTASLECRLPWDFGRGLWTSGLEAGLGTTIGWITDQDVRFAWEQHNGRLAYLTARVTAWHATQWIRDIQPRWGGQVRVTGTWADPSFSEYVSTRLTAEGILYFPGLLPNHGVRVGMGWEGQRPDQFRFSPVLGAPRGTDTQYHDQRVLLRTGYVLPLAYPDVPLWSLINVKRIRATFFSDAGWEWGGSPRRDLLSSGLEGVFDVNLFSTLAEFGIGVRWSYVWKERRSDWGMVLSSRL